MTYTVSQAAKLLEVAPSTLRYYEAEGLLPHIKRTESGRRQFDERNIETCRIIECLKISGLSIKDIRDYMVLVQQGDSTIADRSAMLQTRRSSLLQEIEQLKETLAVLDFKCWYYEEAAKAGTEEVVQNLAIEQIPVEHRTTYIKIKHGESV